MILVVGATGTNGLEVVRQLRQGGHAVRAMVREPGKVGEVQGLGAEIVAGDLGDVASIGSALAGADHAFLVAAVDQRYPSWIANFVEAAKRSGSPHVVKFSAIGADPDSPIELIRQHGLTDRLVVESGLPCTFLRPNSFYQNVSWSMATIKDHGAFYLPMGDARQSQVDVRDIAAVAVKALTEPGHEGKTYELTGPEALSNGEIAAALSEATGKSIRYVAVPPEAAEKAMLDSGMPAWNARAVTELYGLFASGATAGISPDVERVTGHSPIPFKQFARDFAGAFA